MEYIVIDLEFNNMESMDKNFLSLYKDKDLNNMGLANEIIEIGVVKLDKFMRKIGEFKRYVKPTLLKFLNPTVKAITGIKEEDLKGGIGFCEAMDDLKDFIGENPIICSWAKDDVTEIINNANYYEYNNLNWLNEYIDIQEYVTKILGNKKSLSLKHALEALKIKFEKTELHDALNDAFYTAEVFKRLYNSRILKNYIVKDIYNMPAIKVEDLKNIELDESKIDYKCPKCNSQLKIEEPFEAFSWRFISLDSCPKCSSKVLNELVIKRTLSGEEIYSQIKTIISEAEYLEYSYKFEKVSSINSEY